MIWVRAFLWSRTKKSSVMLQAMPPKQGYEYIGRVQFVQQQRSGAPVLRLSEFAGVAEDRQDATHHTVMVTRSGHAYTKRCICLPPSHDIAHVPQGLSDWECVCRLYLTMSFHAATYQRQRLQEPVLA